MGHTAPVAQTGAAQLQADGIPAAVINLMQTSICHELRYARKAWPGTLVQPCLLSGYGCPVPMFHFMIWTSAVEGGGKYWLCPVRAHRAGCISIIPILTHHHKEHTVHQIHPTTRTTRKHYMYSIVQHQLTASNLWCPTTIFTTAFTRNLQKRHTKIGFSVFVKNFKGME